MSTPQIPPHLAHLTHAEIIAQARLFERARLRIQREVDAHAENQRKDAEARNMTDADWARKSFAAFVRQAWPFVPSVDPLVWGWHLDAICLHLEAVAKGEIRNLLINVGPGHAKSVLMVVLWPAWVWAWWPKCQFLFGSYAVDIAIRDSVRCRAVIDSDWYQASFARPGGWRLRGDQNAKQYFVNSLGGERFSTGIGGTGRRAHIIGVDDPLQREKAYSKAARDEANLWIGETLSQRFVDAQTGCIAMIQQRLHEEDSSGYVLAGGGWEHLMLPSEFDAGRRCITHHTVAGERLEFWRDPREHDGDLLFPDRFPRAVLDGFKAPNKLGIDGYASQHQQLPTPATGNMFQRDWWRFHKPDGIRGKETAPRPRGCYEGPAAAVPDTFDQIIISIDANFKNAEAADPVSIGVIGCLGADVYVLERQSGPYGFNRTKAVLYDVWCRWEARFVRKVLIELAANGQAILEALEGLIPGILGSRPDGSKEARAWAIQPQVQAGQVHLPDGAPWLDEWISQFAAFPRGKHDDDVDMLSQALIDLRASRYVPPSDLGASLRPRTDVVTEDDDWDDDR